MKQSVLIISVLYFLLTGCSKTYIPEPAISLNTIEDYIYPCVKVSFDSPIEYVNTDHIEESETNTIIYNVKMPSKQFYTISIVKKQSLAENKGWFMAPVSEQYGDTVRVYKIEDNGISDKSAVVAMIDKEGDIFMRSVIGENIGADHIYMVISDRIIYKKEYKHLFNFEKWKESATGKKFINDMKNYTDNLFKNTDMTDCRVLEKPDSGI